MDEFSIWIVQRSDSFLIYRTFADAQRACRMWDIIEEWRCFSGEQRFRCRATWVPDRKGNFVRE